VSGATSPLTTIARLLEQAAVPYVVIGAHAVNAWVEPRITADIDVTAAVDGGGMTRLTNTLVAEEWSVGRAHGVTQPSGPDFVRFISSDAVITLEVQAAKTDFQREVIRRAVMTDDGVRVASPEDLIVLKLIANRPKDQVDLLALAALPDLDWPYVERWADAWGVRALLDALRPRT
jgi:hypothetical protein